MKKITRTFLDSSRAPVATFAVSHDSYMKDENGPTEVIKQTENYADALKQ